MDNKVEYAILYKGNDRGYEVIVTLMDGDKKHVSSSSLNDINEATRLVENLIWDFTAGLTEYK